jgi:hypothetical protein
MKEMATYPVNGKVVNAESVQSDALVNAAMAYTRNKASDIINAYGL